jgi:uncharacterized membrane protein
LESARSPYLSRARSFSSRGLPICELERLSNESRASTDCGRRGYSSGLSLLTYGLSHFFEFAARTVSLVPPWLPYRAAWAYLAGAAQIAAGLGVLFSIYPRISAAMEAAMLSAFTVLVWIPAVVTKPASASNWVEFLFTFALACAAWVIAESIPGGRSEHMVGGATGR